MSGILGIWNLDGRPVEGAILARLSATLAHRGPDAEGLWVQGSVGLASRLFRVTPESSTEIQPLVHSSGAVVVFDGRLDNREELLKDLKSCSAISAASPDPALVLAAYEAFGDRFPERLSGDFALGLFDPRRQQLLLARDAIGARPLYYYRTSDIFIFASEIKAILAHPQIPSRPNDPVLADFLMGGDRDTPEMTCFEDVFSLPPAHLSALTTRGFVTRRYWDFDPTRRTRLGSFEEYTEAFRQYFEQAVQRRLRSAYPVVVSVSGGLDSSSLFCLAETLRQRDPAHAPPLLGISYTSADGTPSDEKAFLLEIERAYDTAIERLPMDSPGFMNGAREAVWHSETPDLDEQWNTMHRFLITARERGARVLLTGHWGDQVLFSRAYLIDLFHRPAWCTLRAHLKEFGRWMTDADPRAIRQRFLLDLLQCHLPDALRPFLRTLQTKRHLPWYTERFRRAARLRTTPQRVIRTTFPTLHSQSLYEEARSHRHVQCMEWNNKVASVHGLEMAFPFLDRDLLSFLMSIPGEMQTWNGVPKALLREAMRGVLPEAIVHRTWKADFTHHVNEGMQRDYPQLVHCLLAGGLAVQRGYLKENVLRKKLIRLQTRIQGPTCEIAWRLSALVGLELWLQVFDGKNTDDHRAHTTYDRRARVSVPGGMA